MSSGLCLPGCRPAPLSHYLKALGLLRVIGTQADDQVKAWWEGDAFYLDTTLDQDAILAFILEQYVPTPIVVPWSGNDFFGAERGGDAGPFSKVPTASKIIEAFLAQPAERLSCYRSAVLVALNAMQHVGLACKAQIEGSGKAQKALKARYIEAIRACGADDLIPWIDAASLTDGEKATFNTLLGSGGGSDGNSHFSDNFMQCLWICLPEFDGQRAKGKGVMSFGVPFDSAAALKQSLFGGSTPGVLIGKLSPGLFNSAAVGGPNATAGFDANAASNPWDYILMLEGACTFAGALGRRSGEQTGRAAFPFLVDLTAASYGSASSNDTQGREIWLPLWGKPAGNAEVRALFAEARAEVSGRPVRRGVDMARAVASYGVDRGITAFARTGIVRGRVGGDNYNTALSLGRWDVTYVPQITLVNEIEGWLDRARRAAGGERAPASFARAVRALDSAIMELCGGGSAERVQRVLFALGSVEKILAKSPKIRSEARLSPVPPLSPAWLDAADDGSAEFRLACALGAAGIREHLEPVRVGKYASWTEQEKPAQVVWGGGPLVDNLLAVADRRLVDSLRAGGAPAFPTFVSRPAPLGDIASFVRGHVDDLKIEELLWGIAAIGFGKAETANRLEDGTEPLPLAYALLKLCFLPVPLQDKIIPPNPAIISRARACDGAAATRLASQRLYASGFSTRLAVVADDPNVVRRAAAALVVPISSSVTKTLAGLVLRPTHPENKGE